MKNFQRCHAVQHIEIRNDILQFERHGNNEVLTVYLNFGKKPASLTYEGPWTLIKTIDSSDKQWNGPGSQLPDNIKQKQSFTINPFSAVVFDRTAE